MNNLDQKIVNKIAKISWVGTGVMGLPMAKHFMDEGFDVTVYTRTPSKARSLVESGARLANSLADAADSDFIFTMVGYPEDVEAVYFNGLLANAKKGTVLIDMTTTKPSLAKKIAQEASSKGLHTLDAPVSGGDVGARNRSLSIMVGGAKPLYQLVLPLFQVLGKQIVYQGEAGAGQHCKMCNQIVIASTMIGVCESLIYGSWAGLNLETMLSSISGGAAGCWTLENLAPRILKRNFDPGFFVDHFIKDMGIALEECRRMSIKLEGLELASRLYLETQKAGHGLLGTHALMMALEKICTEG